jgi:hypothetical protein
MSENTVCPVCLRASYHPKDIEHKFCAACSIYYAGHPMMIEEMALNEVCAADYAPNPPCDCPRVHYHVNRCCLEVHYEPDGTVHAILDDGANTEETSFSDRPDWWAARQAALLWAQPFVTGPER